MITQEFRSPVAVRRGVIAGVVGNMLEWYDFVEGPYNLPWGTAQGYRRVPGSHAWRRLALTRPCRAR